ncbi:MULTISPECIES: hypothetical protein [unclassified Lysobacter]|uniref:hypothetical protein n=1 Tax=unclassified Lysobacter TaxID=2635362 RepID=UPI0007003B0B|nr:MULTISPECIES: hypothetical protein [unclassified Lysobacter]KQZ66223.1 hypothetical protein ASD53_17540 [Lysobacter sp. Root559]KRC30925.1 hypothetical protein ASE10_18765 [Lysobacter sp. Root76]KRD67713.1 hypothetical protein ASE45_13260 [Lysobacter sp. Root96]
MRSTSRLLLALLLTPGLSACQPAAPEAAHDDTGRIAFADAAATRVGSERAPLPARYAAALPETVADLEHWWDDRERFPPPSHAIDGVVSGDAGWIGRLRRSAERVPAGETQRWAAIWQARLEYREVRPAFCASTRAIAAEPDSTLRRALMPAFAKHCAGPEDAAAVLRNDTPDAAVLDYYSQDRSNGGPRPAFAPRLARAARNVFHGDDEQAARRAAFVLAELHQPEANATLLTLHGEIRDQERADQIAMAFLRSDSGPGRTQAQLACTRRSQDPMCEELRKPKPAAAAQSQQDPDRAPPAKVRARIEQLQNLGFARVGDIDPSKLESADAVAVLQAAGYAHWFDVETGEFPNQHDSLLRELAELVRPALDGVVFEEVAPDNDDGPYQLFAYADGMRYRTQAENHGDWYDVDAVLRLLDALLQARKSSDRYLALDTGDQSLVVVGGPRAAIDAALRQKLLKPGDPAEAERAGKAFETEVLDKLRAQGEAAK